MNTPTKEEILQAMSTYGGSFVQALAEAWRKADAVNELKLRTAFSNYYKEYGEFALRVHKDPSLIQ
jgi:hypothetical protein